MLLFLSQVIDRINLILGRIATLAVMAVVIVTFGVVLFRYGFNQGSIAVQESITYFHAFAFMMGMSLTFQHDQHVRVDIFYRNFSPSTKAWVNGIGSIVMLIPLCVFIFGESWDYVLQSWSYKEASSSGNGLPYVYILKTFISGMTISLALQGVSELIKALSLLTQEEEHTS